MEAIIKELSQKCTQIFFLVDSLCQRPSAPKNGEAMGMVYRKGDKAIFSCKHGYKLSGQDHPVCDANGSWEGFTPSCIAGEPSNSSASRNHCP